MVMTGGKELFHREMTDCYRILGISPRASADEIRAAYIGKMKVLHPDRAAEGAARTDAAREVNAAYWQLRDDSRRADHDRRLFAPVQGAGGARLAAAPGESAAHLHPQIRRSTGLARAAAVALIVTLAAPGALFWFGATQSTRATAGVTAPATIHALAPERRPLDSAMRAAAVDDFSVIMVDMGLEAARSYSRQCLQELAARPTIAMLDYCVAFDDTGAGWERSRRGQKAEAAFFSADQRARRYGTAANAFESDDMRGAMRRDADYMKYCSANSADACGKS